MSERGEVEINASIRDARINRFHGTAIEDNAKLQVMAEPFGDPVPFASEHIQRAMQTRGMLEVAKAVWRFWEHKVETQGIPL